MKKLNIYFNPYAYYVRLDTDDFEENEKKSSAQKWMDNRKGMLSYDFVEFRQLDKDFNLDLPKIIKKIGLVGSSLLTYNPLKYKSASAPGGIFIPAKVVISSEVDFDLFFSEGQSGKIDRSSKYYTAAQSPWIEAVNFSIDGSGAGLTERISYSNGSYAYEMYHLVSKTGELQKAGFYSIFDFNA